VSQFNYKRFTKYDATNMFVPVKVGQAKCRHFVVQRKLCWTLSLFTNYRKKTQCGGVRRARWRDDLDRRGQWQEGGEICTTDTFTLCTLH